MLHTLIDSSNTQRKDPAIMYGALSNIDIDLRNVTLNHTANNKQYERIFQFLESNQNTSK